MHKIEIPEDIKNFVKGLQEQVKDNFTVYLAGGMLRDLYTDKTPKDVDVFFVPKEDVSNKELNVSNLPAKSYIQYNKLTTDIKNNSDMEERGVYQVIGLSNKTLSTPEIQFIVYEKPMTMVEVAEDFDINICGAVWCPLVDTLHLSEDFISGHDNKCIILRKDVGKKRAYDRVIRMMDKFPEYEVESMPPLPEEYKKKEEAKKKKKRVRSLDFGDSSVGISTPISLSPEIKKEILSASSGGSFVGDSDE